MWQPSQKLQDGVAYLARRWSRDDYSQADDLYQEGMLAIWLKNDTQAPWSHQLRTAQNRMLSVRKLGKSVDGKLDRTYKRDKPYLVLPLDGDGVILEEGPDPSEEPIPDPLDLEEDVIARLTVLEITSFLTPRQRHLVKLLCLGFTVKEIAGIEGVNSPAVWKCLLRVKAKVKMVLGETRREYQGSQRGADERPESPQGMALPPADSGKAGERESRAETEKRGIDSRNESSAASVVRLLGSARQGLDFDCRGFPGDGLGSPLFVHERAQIKLLLPMRLLKTAPMSQLIPYIAFS